jgi:hypothetical protein
MLPKPVGGIMAKISIDVQEIKKELKARALNAKSQFEELAKRAQKDFSQTEVLKKIDQLVEVVKSQEFMKNPKVIELTKKVMSLSEQIKSQVGAKLEKRTEQAKGVKNVATEAVKKAKSAATGKRSKNPGPQA